MNLQRRQYKVRVAVRSPFLFQGTKVAAHGLDASAICDEEGAPIIPADHLRGHLQAALRDFCDLNNGVFFQKTQLTHLFGGESAAFDPAADAEHDRPNPGHMFLSDLKRELILLPGKENEPTKPMTGNAEGGIAFRVKIDAATGAAEDGMLQCIELVAPPEAIVLFCGNAVVYEAVEATLSAGELLLKALRWIPAMGALKSVGFGEIVADQCAVEPATVAATTGIEPPDPLPNSLSVEVSFDRPILVNAQRIADNIFEGQTVVPGAAIKGALARRLKLNGHNPEDLRSEIGQALSAITIGHAYPLDATNKNTLDQPLPLSLAFGVVGGEEKLADALLSPARTLIDDEGLPTFQSDWKGAHFQTARARINRQAAEIPALARTRTAIGEQGVSADQKLFVTVARGAVGRRWRFMLHRGDGIDAAIYREILQTLFGGLDGLGRTDATLSVVAQATVEISRPKPITSENGESWVVMLETPAVMTDPFDTRPVAEQYQDFFTFASGGSVTLTNHFAQRVLAGGHAAMRRRAYGRDRYHPFELTSAGSVFLLSGPLLGAYLAKATRYGLPSIRREGADLISLNWRDCPYVGANGYGAISCDPTHHDKLRWRAKV